MSQLPVETTKFDESAGSRPPQRRFARAAVALDASYTLEGGDAIQGHINNLGGGGARLASRDDLQRGSLVTLRFTVPENSRQITARGKVVLSFFDAASERFAHGIAFTQIDPEDQRTIVKYVEAISHTAPDL